MTTELCISGELVPGDLLTEAEATEWCVLMNELVDAHERFMVSWVDSVLHRMWLFVLGIQDRLSAEQLTHIRSRLNTANTTCWSDGYIRLQTWRAESQWRASQPNRDHLPHNT